MKEERVKVFGVLLQDDEGPYLDHDTKYRLGPARGADVDALLAKLVPLIGTEVTVEVDTIVASSSSDGTSEVYIGIVDIYPKR